MSLKKTLCCLLLAILALASAAHAADELLIAAAADLQFAMPELASQFEKQTGQKVTISFGSSGNIASQIRNGAPFDLFFSADLNYPRQLDADGLAEPGSMFRYANGQIVLWTLKTSNIDISRGLAVLADSSVHKIAVANPEHAPYGRAAVAALQKKGVYDKVKDKIVLAENISQTAQFVDSGSADVGIVALSLVVAPSVQDKGTYFKIPGSDYPPIEQGCIILKTSKHKPAAQQFVDFIKTPAAKNILQQFGFVALD